MSKNLVIVESPAKAKTINKYLGSDYTVMASIGHIKDLLVKELAVDVDNNFEPHYNVVPDAKRRNKKKVVSDHKNAAMTINEYLAEYLVGQNTRNVSGPSGGRCAIQCEIGDTNFKHSPEPY
ncbi:MAG: toprim domain-containing protein [Pyrinomonadaceae bacterium]